MIAKEFAKGILCENKEGEKPCNICKSCIEFSNNNNPDYTEILPEGNSIKIEQIRAMQDKIIEKPIISAKKVYIIDDSEKMTKEAQNCLLKTLEEPPEFIVIILITANENLMLNTIKSRCTKINFCKLSNKEIIQVLKNKFNIEGISENIINASEGSIRKTVQFEEKKELYETIDYILQNIEKLNLAELVNKSEVIYQNKEEILDILNYINIQIFTKMKTDYNNGLNYTNAINIVEKTKNKLKANTNYDMCIDFLLFKLWEEFNK